MPAAASIFTNVSANAAQTAAALIADNRERTAGSETKVSSVHDDQAFEDFRFLLPLLLCHGRPVQHAPRHDLPSLVREIYRTVYRSNKDVVVK